MSSAVQVSSGAIIMLFALLDIFLTVLYARAGSGVFSRFVCAWEWRLLRRLAMLFGRRAQVFLSLCGPAIVVSLIMWWALLLTVGAALIFHPFLGSAIVTSGGSTPTDFVSAMYAGANSMSIVGSSGFSPQTSSFRLIFMCNSLIGMSVISLTLTYLMQIYNALQQRNSLGLHLFLLSGMTGSSAEMLVRLAPQGRFDSGLNTFSDVASSVVQLKEMHHFYPVLLYLRFEEAYYSVYFIVSIVLDCASFLQTAIDEKEYEWLQRSGTVAELWSGSMMLLKMIEGAFGPVNRTESKWPMTEFDVDQWRRHYMRSVGQFERAGISRVADLEQEAGRYVDLRREWAPRIRPFADAMLYPIENVDFGTAKEGGSNRVLSFRT